MLSPPDSSSNEGAQFRGDHMEMEDSTGNDFVPNNRYSHIGDIYDSEDDISECSCNGFCSNSTRIPGLCPFWEYCWSDVPLTSSAVTLSPDFIQLPQHIKAIRLGAIIPEGLKNVFIYCYLNHMEKQMGCTIQAVTCFYEPDRFVELNLCGVDDEGRELFAASFAGRPEDQAAITLKFRFYLASSTSVFQYHLFDVRLGDQLWVAAVNQHLTDVMFLVGDRSFPAHKFILAARSPVFSAMFGTDMVESRTGRVKLDDVDPDTFHQFLSFLYTGQLEEPASHELAFLADKYDVQILTAICKSSSFTFGADAEDLFASVRSDKARIHLLFPILDEGMAASFWKSADVSLTEDPPWAVCKVGGHSLMASMTIHLGYYATAGPQPHSFRGNFIMPDQICLSGGRPDQDVSRIVEVFCSSKRCIMGDDHPYFTRMNPLSDPPGSEDAEPPIQKFTATPHPFDLMRIVRFFSDVGMVFHVCHSPSIPEFRYAFRDCYLSGNLWSSSVNKEWTDVDFQVGGKTFSAHRALLAARCPALIPPGSNDSSAPVRIVNLEASVFEELLTFLYTGELKTFPPSEALYEAAVTYQVGLLKRLFEMRPPKPKAADDISPDCPVE